MAVSEETFFLDPAFEGTLQQQIQSLVAEGILSGRLRSGEKLPSTRKLARHLGISRITVTLAYTDLVADDYLVSKGRSGYFVSDSAPPARRMDLGPGPDRTGLDWARRIGRRSGRPRAQHADANGPGRTGRGRRLRRAGHGHGTLRHDDRRGCAGWPGAVRRKPRRQRWPGTIRSTGVRES